MSVVGACHPGRVGAKRSVRLRVIGATVELRDDIPKTRSDCPEVSREHPCGHIKCQWHLWLITGPDRAGRRFTHRTDIDRPSTMRLVMLEWPVPRSCLLQVLEIAAREGWGHAEMAAELGLSMSGFNNLLVKARGKLKERGVTLREFLDDGDASRGMLDPEER